jgi:NADH-quinone oxidoreductase subunit L
MAGPTPVSALIHAATMVAAGAYLLVRLFPLVSLSPLALMLIAAVGALTSLYGACAALAQKDIKAVLAYSTMSQLGYMFLAVGAADLVGAMFHLVSHAFFKALLFLYAGCVIRALAGEHDIFRMGNLRRLLPGVYWLGLIGALCLSAFPLIGGFFSKDRILLATFIYPHPVYKVFWGMAALGALMTPLYAFRLLLTVSSSRPEGPGAPDLKPIPQLMVWALWPLALLALLDGMLNLPLGPGKRWLSDYLSVVPGSRPELGASAGLDRGYVWLGRDLVLALSRGLGLWATGRISTYLAMLFLGLTLILVALAAGWRLW